MDTIICPINVKDIITNIRNKMKDMNIQDIHLVDINDEEAVILVSEQKITEQIANAFWLGYKRALQ